MKPQLEQFRLRVGFVSNRCFVFSVPLSLGLLVSIDEIYCVLQFVVFAEREEGNTPYHRQYDFFIQRFASLSLVANNGDDQKYKE